MMNDDFNPQNQLSYHILYHRTTPLTHAQLGLANDDEITKLFFKNIFLVSQF